MARLEAEFLERVEKFSHRMVDVAEAIDGRRASRRIVDQIVGSGTSPSANLYEADEAQSPAEFCRCVGVAVRELNESRFWLRFVGERGWVKTNRLSALIDESESLRKILGSMIARTRRRIS